MYFLYVSDWGIKGSMIFITKTSDQTRQRGLSVCVCVFFIKLHITTKSGPVIVVILCHTH